MVTRSQSRCWDGFYHAKVSSMGTQCTIMSSYWGCRALLCRGSVQKPASVLLDSQHRILAKWVSDVPPVEARGKVAYEVNLSGLRSMTKQMANAHFE